WRGVTWVRAGPPRRRAIGNAWVPRSMSIATPRSPVMGEAVRSARTRLAERALRRQGRRQELVRVVGGRRGRRGQAEDLLGDAHRPGPRLRLRLPHELRAVLAHERDGRLQLAEVPRARGVGRER